MRFKILPFLGVICLLCFSCSYKQQHALFQDKPAQTASITQGTIPTAYHIKADDILQIRNLENYKFLAPVEGTSNTTGSDGAGSQTYQVEEDGSVTLPVIGHIPVAGLTRYEAARKIETLYRANLLKNAIIELKVLNLKVTVLGEIKSQGNYPLLKDKTTLIDIIGQAGGLNNAADEKNVKIIRKENGSQKTIWVDLSDVNILNSPNIILQDDDIVYIAQNKRAVRDDKIQNFSTLVQPSLLIFNTALILYTLFR